VFVRFAVGAEACFEADFVVVVVVAVVVVAVVVIIAIRDGFLLSLWTVVVLLSARLSS
jgi:hypothetical protein